MPRKINEDQTRKQMIDPQLEQVGWYLRDRLKIKVRGRQFKTIIAQHNYYINQIMQSEFLQKRHLKTADLYEPPLDSFGADAVERWFTEKEVIEVVEFANRMARK
jgi:type I site-specific restriction endonuclease